MSYALWHDEVVPDVGVQSECLESALAVGAVGLFAGANPPIVGMEWSAPMHDWVVRVTHEHVFTQLLLPRSVPQKYLGEIGVVRFDVLEYTYARTYVRKHMPPYFQPETRNGQIITE